MAPPVSRLNAGHRIRRFHPLRPLATRALARAERADAVAIARLQERRLRRLVSLAAARSPFYRDWFRRSGVDARSIQTLTDLQQLPLLDRAFLVEDAERFCVYPPRLMWPAHSSGTSGRPVTCYRTPGASMFELTILERQWAWYGLRRGARRVVLRGSEFAADRNLPPTKLLTGARQLLVSSYRLTPQDLPRIVADVRSFEAEAIEGWPSSITILASLLCERGLTLPVRAVITSSEVMSAPQRALMKQAFGGPVVDHYGQTERVAMAGSCEFGGYHVFPDYGIVELLPVPGLPDRWEIVGTPLHNWGFPLFRYRTGDFVGRADPAPCECGRAFEPLGRIDGRIEDCFAASDGRPLPLPSIVVDDLAHVRQAQIAQLAPGRFEIRVVPGPGFDLEAVSAQVRRNVDLLFGADQVTGIRVLDVLPAGAGGKPRSAVLEPIRHTSVPQSTAGA